MKPIELFTALGNVQDSYVLSAGKFRQGRQQVKTLSTKKIWFIAAAIALMLLLVGCAVTYVLSLKDMAFGEEVREYYDGSVQTRTLLSVKGVQGTPGYQASKEWYEWLQTYDTDESVYHSEEAFSEDFGDAYYAYNLYSREMKDKVDELCAKYGLELLGKMYVDPDVDAACEALQIQGILRPGVQAEVDWGNVRYYENGSFTVEGRMTLTGEDSPWPHTHIVTFSCDRKDAFGILMGDVGPEGSYEEWTYTTSDGVDVLMVIEKEQIRGASFMIVDRGPYIFSFVTYFAEDETPMEKEGLEAFAEAFDFTMEPQRVSQADMEKSDQRREEAGKKHAEEYKKTVLGYQAKGYEDRIKFWMERCINPDQLGFTLMDIDGNGIDDLVVGQNGYIKSVYTTVDDGTQQLIMQRRGYTGMVNYISIGVRTSFDPTCMYLCQDGCLAFVYETITGEIGYHFAKPENGKLVWAEMIIYNPSAAPGEQWKQYEDEFFSKESLITQARFEEIVASHIRKPLKLLPISQFPLTDDSPSGIGTPETVYDDYGALVRARTRDIWSYSRKDLDEDGQEELILHQDNWTGVFTVAEGNVKLLICGEDVQICEGNRIAFSRTYPDGNQTHCYYKIENGNAVLTDYLRYDKDVNPESPWFRSTDNSGQDVSMVPISQADFDFIRDQYQTVEVDWKPVSAYPFS